MDGTWRRLDPRTTTDDRWLTRATRTWPPAGGRHQARPPIRTEPDSMPPQMPGGAARSGRARGASRCTVLPRRVQRSGVARSSEVRSSRIGWMPHAAVSPSSMGPARRPHYLRQTVGKLQRQATGTTPPGFCRRSVFRRSLPAFAGAVGCSGASDDGATLGAAGRAHVRAVAHAIAQQWEVSLSIQCFTCRGQPR